MVVIFSTGSYRWLLFLAMCYAWLLFLALSLIDGCYFQNIKRRGLQMVHDTRLNKCEMRILYVFDPYNVQ